MTTDPGTLRREADKLAEQAAEAERKAALEEQKRQQMKPQWRVADLIHRHFGHHVGGGPMDAGDEWYYEVPTGRDVEARWMEEWTHPGREHQVYLKIAETFTRTLITNSGTQDPIDIDYEFAERLLQTLADGLGNHRTMVGVRAKAERHDQYQLDNARDKAVESITKLHELAGRPPR